MEGHKQLETEEAVNVLKDISSQIMNASDYVQKITSRLHQGQINTNKGLSFLEMKYQLMLSYLANLVHFMCLKVKGHSIVGSCTIQRLVEIRTVIEKIRPIDKKLKYQLDKLVKTASTGTVDKDNPLNFKPNPNNLISKVDDNDDDEDPTQDEKEKVYKPPKLSAVHYDGDLSHKEKLEKQEQRIKKRILSSRVLKELHDEYYEGPEEITESGDLHRAFDDKKGRERQEYEEKYFVRMSVSKKERSAAKKLKTVGNLHDLAQFGNLSGLTDTSASRDFGEPVKKRKKPGKTKKGKKKRKFQ